MPYREAIPERGMDMYGPQPSKTNQRKVDLVACGVKLFVKQCCSVKPIESMTVGSLGYICWWGTGAAAGLLVARYERRTGFGRKATCRTHLCIGGASQVI